EVSFTIDGATVYSETDGVGGNSGDAVKRYVDAKLTLTPSEDANQVGDAHVFTAELKFDYGDGQGFVTAPAGETIQFSKSGPGDLSASSCTTDANGQCTVTLTSTATGETTVTASWNGTISTARGNTFASASDSATKDWVDALINITPSEDANQVGDEHMFTVELKFDYGDGQGFVAAPAGETIQFSKSGPGDLSASSCTTDANGQCAVTLTSATPGLTSVTASWNGTISVGQVSASANASDGATKLWVDARLSLTPPTAVNAVDDGHVFTAKLEFDYGDGQGFVVAPAGETIQFSKSGPGDLSASSCTTDVNGQCTVTLTSTSAGETTVTASWNGTISSGQVSANASATDQASKRWVDASIRIDPQTANNEVGDSHTFTITVLVDEGRGDGLLPVQGVNPVVTISPTPDSVTDNCATIGTDGAGQCTVVINNNTADLFTADASITLTVDGQSLTRSTSGVSGPGGSDAAEKAYVDARIRIDPENATNNVGESHTFTITVEKNDGGGWTAVSGVFPAVSVSPTPDSVSNNCATIGTDGAGQCTVVINNYSAGTFTANASVTVNVGGLSLTRSTSGNSGENGSGPATKVYVAASIGDYVWHDVDADGLQDPNEQGISGVQVQLFDNGTCSGAPINAMNTGGSGDYLFSGLAVGTYSVKFIPPAGYEFSPKDQGGDDAMDSDADPLSGCAGPINLGANQNDLTWDAGMYQLASVGDFVWNDLDADGIQEANEPGIDDIQVTLFDSGGAPVATTNTSGGGFYLFDGLTPGDYYVKFDLPAGAKFSPKDQGGDDAMDSDADETTGQTVLFTLFSGASDLTWDAGQYCQNPILGTVYEDRNQNQQQDVGEPGIPNVNLDLYRDDGDGQFNANNDTYVDSATTDADGNYSFPPQDPGKYFVVEHQPDGYDSTTDDLLLIELSGSCAAGSAAEDNNFGEVFGSIGDFIFLDSNGNGALDPGETQGIVGVPITVTNLSTNEVFNATSNAQGLYLVDRLVAGTYKVEVPASLPGLLRTTSSPMIVVLSEGQNFLDADFGYISPTSVTLVNFTAVRQTKGVLVQWTTASETNQTGFRVWRSLSADGPFFKAVSDVIPAENNPNGASYEWLDRTAKSTVTYWYKLESLPDGAVFGPTPARDDPGDSGASKVFLPMQLR
ncbi:MAG: hypothetical protein GXP42_16315, partial [Chloroflexi bacterium]|nr:hypothetical protein [Chloroflexota bacterium]